jgi:hypothetical protein
MTALGDAIVFVEITVGLPDDFGIGFFPGQTCALLEPQRFTSGESCYQVVRFAPSAGFVGYHAIGSVQLTARDAVTGEVR